MTLSATGALRRCACSPKNELEYEYMKASYKDCRQGYSKRIGRSSVSTPLVKNPEKSNIRAPWSLVSSRAPSLPSIPFTIPEEEPDTITSLEDLGLSTPKYTGEPLVNLTTRIARHWEEASMSDFMKHPLGKDQSFELRKCHKWDDWVDWSDARFQTPERAEKARCMSHKADAPSNLAFDYTSSKDTARTKPRRRPKHASNTTKQNIMFENKRFGMSITQDGRIGNVEDGGQASRLGVQVGWLVRAINDREIKDKSESGVVAAIASAKATSTTSINVSFGEVIDRPRRASTPASVAGLKPPKTYGVSYATCPIDRVLPAGVPRRRTSRQMSGTISLSIRKYMESITCDLPVLNIPSHTNTLSG